VNILVTGGTGFAGRPLVAELLARGCHVRVAGRGQDRGLVPGAQWHEVGDLSGDVDWDGALEGMEAVLHAAGLAHVFTTDAAYDPVLYDKVNHRATRHLVQAMLRRPSIKRFLFVSSLGVHGGAPPQPITPGTPYAPVTPYDWSKVAAENAIRELLPPEAMRWAILRPALIYGPGHRGKMAKLEKMIKTGIPVPLGKPNRRSFLFVLNLADAMAKYLCASEPPSGRVWPLADEPPVATETLVRCLACAMGVRPRLLHLPAPVLDALTALGDGLDRLGLPSPWTSEVRMKLLGDFHVDLAAIREELGWRPPFTLEEGLALTYRTEMERRRRRVPGR
jgi:nucleoside-diphosphate-sugar epimerase